jgi:hypothetical protein
MGDDAKGDEEGSSRRGAPHTTNTTTFPGPRVCGGAGPGRRGCATRAMTSMIWQTCWGSLRRKACKRTWPPTKDKTQNAHDARGRWLRGDGTENRQQAKTNRQQKQTKTDRLEKLEAQGMQEDLATERQKQTQTHAAGPPATSHNTHPSVTFPGPHTHTHTHTRTHAHTHTYAHTHTHTHTHTRTHTHAWVEARGIVEDGSQCFPFRPNSAEIRPMAVFG